MSDPSLRVGVVDGEPAVTLAAGELEATFLPGLGLLGTSLRPRGQELLALPGGVAGYRDGHVTGLPILAPWANRLPGWRYRAAGAEVDLDGLDLHTDPGGLPIHGTVTAFPELLAAFPFPHRLAATGERPVPVAFGWHPYLRLPGAPRADWRLLLPDRTHLDLDDRGLPTGKTADEPAEAERVGDRTFDDLYALGQRRLRPRPGVRSSWRRSASTSPPPGPASTPRPRPVSAPCWYASATRPTSPPRPASASASRPRRPGRPPHGWRSSPSSPW